MVLQNTYLKDVEDYFLSHAGKGIMLSPKEYELIVKWKGRGIPKEVVFKGISNAIDNYKNKAGRNESPKSLIHCAHFIEEEIKRYSSVNINKSKKLESKPNDFIEKILDRLAKIIRSEERENIRKHYMEARKGISLMSDLEDEDIFKALENIENQFYESIFQNLQQTEKERINSEAENMISKRSRSMTEKAHRESVLAFRNEILARDYELKSIISYN